MWKYVLAWLPMVPIAIANGATRELGYGKHLGELQAHQVSSLTALLLLGIYTWLVIRLWTPASASQAVGVGALWSCLTVTFEFGFGHYVAGHPWGRLLADYNILAGRLGILVLLAAAPYLLFRLQRIH